MTIKTTDVTNAVQKRIYDSLIEYPIIYEGEDSVPERPYIALQIVRLKPTAVMLEPHDGYHPAFLQATVVTEFGHFATEGQDIGDEIVKLFRFGTRITIDTEGHELTVNDIPFVETGFRDGMDWRTPVRIDYEVQ